LFTTVQVLLVLGQTAAVCGTVTSPDTDYANWSSAWPLAADALPALLQRPVLAQDVAIAGICAPQNLLDLLRNFVVFSPLPQPATVQLQRQLAWCSQFTLVNRALQRCRLASGPEMWATASWDASVFGGVLCVPPGGDQSLIFGWLALKLRRDRQADHPTLLLLTDRPSLAAQLRQLFAHGGLPHPVSADDSQHLLQLLVGPGGQTLVATVQQLRALQQAQALGSKSPAPAPISPRLREELALESLDDGHLEGLVSRSLRDDAAAARPRALRSQARGPALSTARNLFVLIDNVQQQQTLGLLTELRRALPNAVVFGISEELDAAACSKDAALAALGRPIEATDCARTTGPAATS
jgi:type I restriction enzyme R subunit